MKMLTPLVEQFSGGKSRDKTLDEMLHMCRDVDPFTSKMSQAMHLAMDPLTSKVSQAVHLAVGAAIQTTPQPKILKTDNGPGYS